MHERDPKDTTQPARAVPPAAWTAFIDFSIVQAL
ncbi:DUF397 domain-containing protein [Streptomyces auratus]